MSLANKKLAFSTLHCLVYIWFGLGFATKAHENVSTCSYKESTELCQKTQLSAAVKKMHSLYKQV